MVGVTGLRYVLHKIPVIARISTGRPQCYRQPQQQLLVRNSHQVISRNNFDILTCLKYSWLSKNMTTCYRTLLLSQYPWSTSIKSSFRLSTTTGLSPQADRQTKKSDSFETNETVTGFSSQGIDSLDSTESVGVELPASPLTSSGDFDKCEDKDDMKVVQSPPPPTTLYDHFGPKELYFQWDYRNHPKVEHPNMIRLLKKIEVTLKDTHLEPFGTERGVETMRRNIESMENGTRFRLGRGKSLEVGKRNLDLRRYTVNGVLKPHGKKLQRKMNIMLRTRPLMKSLLKLLCDRHSVYASGYTSDLGVLSPKMIGQSFFGPKTKKKVNTKEAKVMLRQFWILGFSEEFNKMRKIKRKRRYKRSNDDDDTDEDTDTEEEEQGV
jgi:hypothetical protein